MLSVYECLLSTQSKYGAIKKVRQIILTDFRGPCRA